MTARGDTPIFWRVVDDDRRGRLRGGRHRWRTDPPTAPIPAFRGAAVTDPQPWTPENPQAVTAAEQDHTDPWAYAGEDTDPPPSTGEDLATWGGA